MVTINLTPEQTQLMLSANEPVLLNDANGNQIATAKKLIPKDQFTPAEIEAARKAASNPGLRLTTAQMLEKLAAIDAQTP